MSTITGTSGHDVLVGTAADDLVQGGAGGDTLVLPGHSADAVFSIDAQGRWVVSSGAGTDTLAGMEWVRFDDGAVALGAHEAPVNTSFFGNQYTSRVTTLADGGYVVSWLSSAQPGLDLYVQRFSAEGTRVGAEIRVTPASGNLWGQSITAMPDGGYLATWTYYDYQRQVSDIAAQRFGADGSVIGGPTNIVAPGGFSRGSATAAPLADGGYVVAWNSSGQEGAYASGVGSGIYAQRFAPDGSAVGAEFHVNTSTYSDQNDPRIVARPQGGFVIVWESAHDQWGVYAQAYAADGTPVGGETKVSTTPGGYQPNPAAVALADGGFVVAWTHFERGFNESGVRGQRFAADGSAIGTEFVVQTPPQSSQAEVAALAGGGYVITWAFVAQDGSGPHIQAQRYAADGSLVGPALEVDTTALAPKGDAHVTGLADGGFAVTWTSYFQDGDAGGIVQQRFAADGTAEGSGDILAGDAGANVIRFAGPQAVDIVAGAGDDRLAGGAGNDTLNGGTGTDTVAVAAPLSGLGWGVDADGNATLASAQGGVDRLVEVERVEAADGVVQVSYGAGDTLVRMIPQSHQSDPQVAALAGGGHVVVWMSYYRDGSNPGLYAQQYGADGGAVGTEFRVNPPAQGDIWDGYVTGLADGSYLVLWGSRDPDSDIATIYGRRYAADGSAAGGEFHVQPTEPRGEPWNYQVTALVDGGFVITWSSPDLAFTAFDVFAQRYAADGSTMGPDFRVNTTEVMRSIPVVAALQDGGYVVVWSDMHLEDSTHALFAQRFAADGTRAGGEFEVVARTADVYSFPSGTALADGGFIVGWSTTTLSAYDWSVYTQRYGADGMAAGGAVHQATTRANPWLDMTALADGGYVVAWTADGGADGGSEVVAQNYGADGMQWGSEYRLNGTRLHAQFESSIAGLADGSYLATWVSDGAIYSQRFLSNGARTGHLTITGDAQANTLRVDANSADTVELAGGAGNDILSGGGFADILVGGAGRDTFEFAARGNGVDRITDWSPGDAIRVAGSTFAGPVVAGVGTAVGRNQVEVSTIGGTTTLYIGTDDAPGADVIIQLQGGFSAGMFSLRGDESIRFDAAAPAVPLVALANDTGRPGDGITSDASLAIGAVDAGNSVEFSTDGATWSTIFTPAEGPNTVQVRQRDAAGDVGDASSFSFTLDTTAAAPVVALALDTGTAGDGVTSDASLVLAGIEAGAQVEYSVDGTNWMTTFAAMEGANFVQVRQRDVAGNLSGASALSFVHDTQAAAPAIALATDSGVDGDRITNSAALALGGIEAGAAVEYSGDGTSWTDAFTATEGANTVQIRQRDVAGNVSGASALSFTLDTQAPAPTVALATDTGIFGDRITSNASLAISSLEAGAAVEYSLDGTNWSGAFSAIEGANSVQVRQRDIAGNVSGASTLAFTLDTQVALPALALANDTGMAGDRITSNAALGLSGIEAGAAVEYSLDGTNWANTFTSTEGANTVQARQRDVSGNVSGATLLAFTLDTQAAAPGVALAIDSGISGDRITSNAALSLTGLEAGAAVEYSIDGTNWATTFAAMEGANSVQVRQRDVAGNLSGATALSFTLDTQVTAPTMTLAADTGIAGDRITNNAALALTGIEVGAAVEYSTNGTVWTTAFTATEGANSVQVRQRDLAGNLSGASTLAFTLDTKVVAPGVALATDSGIAGDRITNNSALALTGIETGATVEYSTNGSTWGGSYSAAQGLNTVYVRQRDLAGNQGAGTALTFTFDNQVTAPVVALTTDTGIAGDRISRVGTLTVSGIEAGAAVQYSKDGVLWSGAFAAAEGANTVQVRQSDLAGNVSAATVLAFTLDTVANAPVVTLANDSGIAGDRITNNAAFALTGVESGATVQYSRDAVNWSASFTPTQGTNTVYARQTDVAGNLSAPSAALNFTYDTVAPGAAGNLADTQIVNGYVNAARNIAAQTLTGTSPALATVTVWDGATAIGTVTANNLGRWNLLLGSLADGSHSLTATTSDVAGNVSASSAALAFKVDTQGPATLITDVVQTNATTTIVKGTSEANSTVAIREFNGPVLTTTAPVIADAAGQWTATLRNIGNIDHVLVASGTDAANNIGLASNQAILGTTAGDNLAGAGNGNLVLGNGGMNFLAGGTGVDKFVFHANMGGNFVFGFNPAEDVLYIGRDVVPVGVTTNAQLEAWVESNASDVFGSAYIQIDAQQTIALVGVPTANLALLNYALL